MQKATKEMIKCAIINCGIATGIINGVLAYFTLNGDTLALPDLTINFWGTAIGCGLLCPAFGKLILKNVNTDILIEKKSNRIVGRWIPDNFIVGTLVICVLATILLFGIPYCMIQLFPIELQIGKLMWAFVLGGYSMSVASFSAYHGMYSAYYRNGM